MRQKSSGARLCSLILGLMLICPAALVSAAAPQPEQDLTTGMVVSSHHLADAIGKAVLDNGGNAVDAAVAVGYALAVVHPSAGNIGGGGFAVITLADGSKTTIDFREVAPAKATRDMYLDDKGDVAPELSTTGYLAAGVPGTVAGLCALRDKYGTKPLAELMAPAIKLAEEGFEISLRQQQTMEEAADKFKRFASTRKYFLKADGEVYQEGELLLQKDLAKTLKLISQKGPDGFYKGAVADLIEKDMKANGGLITKEDLANYAVAWREPALGSYRGYEIVSMAPPSSGGVHLVQILNVLENAELKEMGFGSAKTVHLMAEAMRYAFADRSEYLGDPAFAEVPAEQLMAKEYAKNIYDQIVAYGQKARPSSEVRPGLPPKEKTQTTHYSVLDWKGNAVAVTYTINDTYGSAAALDGAGFLLNNEMDDFVAKPGVPNIYGLVGGQANAVEPGKRPLSSMTPTIVLKDDKPFLVVGSPGGPRIITSTLQTIINVIDHGMNISQAVYAPRVHMQWLPDELRVEAFGLSPDTSELLKTMGYNLSVQPDMGDVNAIMVDQESGLMTASSDPRREF